MKRSENRILTTHAGSLPRPQPVKALQEALQAGRPVDEAEYAGVLTAAVADVVRKQAEVGVTVVNDGEVGKIGGFAAYVRARLNGYEDAEYEPRPLPGVARHYPDMDWSAFGGPNSRRAIGRNPVSWKAFQQCEQDISNLKAAIARTSVEGAFLPASSPATIFNYNGNSYYATRRDYLDALADVMKREYDAIAASGLILQIDCPDLAASWDGFYSDLSIPDFRKMVAENIEVLNHATRDIPPDQMRIHTCWGAGAGPHSGDVEMRDLVDLLLKARPAGLSFVAANGRHEWEWQIWQEVKLPDGKVLIPGVIDSTAPIVEHPETVAERIVRFASAVGRENVIAGTDCGFGYALPASVAWAKLKALGDGAQLASKRLWTRAQRTPSVMNSTA